MLTEPSLTLSPSIACLLEAPSHESSPAGRKTATFAPSTALPWMEIRVFTFTVISDGSICGGGELGGGGKLGPGGVGGSGSSGGGIADGGSVGGLGGGSAGGVVGGVECGHIFGSQGGGPRGGKLGGPSAGGPMGNGSDVARCRTPACPEGGASGGGRGGYGHCTSSPERTHSPRVAPDVPCAQKRTAEPEQLSQRWIQAYAFRHCEASNRQLPHRPASVTFTSVMDSSAAQLRPDRAASI